MEKGRLFLGSWLAELFEAESPGRWASPGLGLVSALRPAQERGSEPPVSPCLEAPVLPRCGPGGRRHCPRGEKAPERTPGSFSVLLPPDSPFSTCVFPQGAWKWLLSGSLFHSGTKSFSAVDDLFWTSFFFFWSACFVRVSLLWAPHERCFIPWLILRNRASHVGRAVRRHRWH